MAGGDAKSKDYVVQARAELIGENATVELLKIAGNDESEAEPAAVIVETEVAKPAVNLSALDAALAKGDAAVACFLFLPLSQLSTGC